MKKHAGAFTVVELIIVVVIISILSTISVAAYVSVQKQSRDSTRESRAKNIASALEKYYKNNGEYPGCMAMTQSASLVSSNVLTGLNSDNLATPTATSGTNSIHCTDMTNTSSDVFSYVGDGTTTCSTGSACSSFTLKYISEDDSTVKSISSKHNSTNTSDILFQNSQGQKVTAVSIAAGLYHTCALLSDGTIYCWGDNEDGQLGNGTTANSLIPVKITMTGALSGKTVTQITAGDYFTCARTSDGKAYCWGLNGNGQLGTNDYVNYSVPTAVYASGALSGKTVTQISAGDYHTCALTSDGKVYCWGFNMYGQLGTNNTTTYNYPVAVYNAGVVDSKTITQISSGKLLTCALTSTGKVYCWGYNYYGQLGTNNTTDAHIPTAVYTSGVLSGVAISNISAGRYFTCATSNSGSIFQGAAYCWGYNQYGQLGDNTTTNRSAPVIVYSSGVLYEESLSAVAVGYSSSCVLSTDGGVYCWGHNGYGELGNGSIDNSSVPVNVSISSATAISTFGGYHTCVVASGKIYCWGYNNDGQLGNNSTATSTTPVQAKF